MSVCLSLFVHDCFHMFVQDYLNKFAADSFPKFVRECLLGRLHNGCENIRPDGNFFQVIEQDGLKEKTWFQFHDLVFNCDS